MLKLFLKRSKGSISVFVVIIMVPILFLMGFLVDLTRIKFCGNQAVMAADNYGEAILTDYDNLLKELYGLFALTQNNEGIEALDRLDEYVRTYYLTSFKPNDNRIRYQHGDAWLETREYEGWMPYQNAVVTMEAKPAPGATLNAPEVFNSQIGDFMKFRIVQTLGEDEGGLINALDSIQNMQGNIKAANERVEIEELAEQALKLAQDYYAELEAIYQYPDYINAINSAYGTGKRKMDSYISVYYSPYREYQVSGPESVEEALERRAELEEARRAAETSPEPAVSPEPAASTPAPTPVPTLTPEEVQLCAVGDAYYDADVYPEDTKEGLEQKLAEYREPVKAFFNRTGTLQAAYAVYDGDGNEQTVVNFENLEDKIKSLQSIAEKLNKQMINLLKMKEKLDETLNSDNVSDALKEGIRKEMEMVDELFGESGDYSADLYLQLAEDLEGNKAQNTVYKQQAQAMYDSMEDLADQCINQYIENPSDFVYAEELGDPREDANWWNFENNEEYKEIYQSLRDCFGELTEHNDKGNKKKKEADALLDSVKKLLDEDETPDSDRDIPAAFGLGDDGKGGNFNILKMIKSAGDNFANFDLGNEANKLWTKLYLTQYDFGMFTSRVTNIDSGEGEEKTVKESLTGFQMAPNINYLYQSEIEFLLGGHNSSKENLNEARNKILAFRAVMNLVATYTVPELNDMITLVSDAFCFPLLVLAVNGALRLAVAGVETYADWQLLKDGKSACVLKTRMGDLSVGALPSDLSGKLNALLGNREVKAEGPKGEKSFSLDYEQYLSVMMIFLTSSEKLSSRTADLITLNVNTVKQKIGSHGELEELTFNMKDTVTAVDVTCAVQLDMIVMPESFARMVVGDTTYQDIVDFEKRNYKFTVTRGY